MTATSALCTLLQTNCIRPRQLSTFTCEAQTPNGTVFGDKAFKEVMRLNEVRRVGLGPTGLIFL